MLVPAVTVHACATQQQNQKSCGTTQYAHKCVLYCCAVQDTRGGGLQCLPGSVGAVVGVTVASATVGDAVSGFSIVGNAVTGGSVKGAAVTALLNNNSSSKSSSRK
jgi:hypothetical protein